jgi:hypothetical protein
VSPAAIDGDSTVMSVRIYKTVYVVFRYLLHILFRLFVYWLFDLY